MANFRPGMSGVSKPKPTVTNPGMHKLDIEQNLNKDYNRKQEINRKIILGFFILFFIVCIIIAIFG